MPGMVPGSLNAAQRQADLDALRDEPPLDLLVVGGGVVGTGVALDAAARGLSVALVERRDLGWGTSRWSSKLVHGGLRYLASGQVGIALESARERDVLLRRTAPHLVRPIPMTVPFTPDVDRGLELMTRVGLRAADGLRRWAGTPGSALRRSRALQPHEALTLAPGLRRAGLRGGVLAWDAQLEDDARLVVAIARTAAQQGARVVTRCGAVALGGDGATLQDELTGERFDVRARAVVNATGVWAGELADGLPLRPSRGTHVILPLERLGGLTGMLNVPIEGDRGRWILCMAQRNGLAYVGLTDVPVDGPMPDVPEPPEEDVVFLLSTLSRALERPLERSDVIGAYAGLRPLVDGDASTTADLSRSHLIHRGTGGLVSVIGGKLTTYRKIAEDAVDAALDQAGLDPRPCPTRELPLVGAADPRRLAAVPAPARLVDRHGTQAPAVMALAGGDPELLEPLAPGLDVLGVEVLHAIQNEGALDADDVLDRRTRIGLVPATRAVAQARVDALVAAARHPALV